ncbi:methyltransferase [bacterium]|nr:methyltransferase [bacterium]
MDHFDRFFATVDRRKVDRPCTWLGLPVPAAYERLFGHFGVENTRELILKLDDDLYPVELPYHSPTSNAIYMAFDFGSQSGKEDERSLTAPGYFENCDDPAMVETFEWPEPAKYIDPAECRRVVEDTPDGLPVMGVIWSAHFQDAMAAYGMESALVQMYAAPDAFRAVIDRIVNFYLEANEIFYSAAGDRLHAVLIGNDFGSQTGLMVSPEMIRKFAFPGTRKLVEQAKRHGLKVIHHSCGSIRPIIDDLIELGVDVIHPIQALAAGMEPAELKREFGGRVAFCGGVDAQHLLVNGTPKEVRDKVRELREIFPTGLIVSPSHEAILPDIPPENVQALFDEAHAKW